jgi:hypothetical protein
VVEYVLRLCEAVGHRDYVGIFGDKSGCALYDISMEWMDADEECVDGAERVVEV